MDDSTAITAGFGVLLVGVLVILAGVFTGGQELIIGAGGILMILSVSGFVIPLFGGDSHHESAAGAD
ncbi:hypothetical protein [Natronolimnobius baerhuensis]|uniref:Uncharacterized protein n=1 Tax=Natronolimnobius baerhuensis TaxID=253108 RepID=A0A202E6J9_9EURY|nr:hypothetical protein [Natronolimnobius baerhuensis]OVE83883.1 hypothetical protein B2G88_15850 [Natronolimnobius baerhuensis]